jgi:hypothetical protein
MSSHHFVKEGQEPAVIVLGNISEWDILSGALEWSPKVIANRTGYHLLLAEGIKVDVCWQDQADAPLLPAPYPVDMEVLENDVDEQIEQWLEVEQQPAYLFGLDELQIITLMNKLPAASSKLLTAISATHKWVSVFGQDFSKWFPEGTELRCHGSETDWTIDGPVAVSWPYIRLTQAGMFSCSSKSFGLLGEPIESFLR